MNAIACVSATWGIGKDNHLLFHISEDLKFFRRTTDGKVLIMGRKTLESLPGGKPLPNRRHLVLSTQMDYQPEGVEVYHSVPELLEAIRDLPSDEVWVCGGGEVYQELLPYCEECYITHVDLQPPADTFFPNLFREKDWTRADSEAYMEEKGIYFRYCQYYNRNIKKF
ncbi:MAG: dihydrofolate reductase [Clostridiales bacterium]|nr:dihydrofolate reductase [Clostridiales bacterium]